MELRNNPRKLAASVSLASTLVHIAIFGCVIYAFPIKDVMSVIFTEFHLVYLYLITSFILFLAITIILFSKKHLSRNFYLILFIISTVLVALEIIYLSHSLFFILILPWSLFQLWRKEIA